jgi:arylsulfatase A-like enzyme/predicted neuraminidase
MLKPNSIIGPSAHRKITRRVVAALGASLLILAGGLSAIAADRPNVVMIVADDQGWTDFGFMGHETIRTPHLDALAAQSALFPNGYVPTSLCRASLATLLTGQFGHQHRICCNDPPAGIDRAQMHPMMQQAPAIPRLLGQNGYRSFQTGKFWEGHFSNAGFTQGMTTKGRHGDEGLIIGRQTMQPIYDFIAAKREQPFFLWYAPMMPHEPHTPPERFLKNYLAEGRSLKLARYYAMCEWFDETCGELLAHLDQQGLRDNTLVLFVVDNGWIQETGDVRTTRGWFAPKSKLSPYDGGLRTPVMVRWPGRTKPGRYDDLVSTVDLAPTILAACGVPVPRELPGLSLLDVAAGRGALSRKQVYGEIYLHTAVDLGRPDLNLTHRWVRASDWKLIAAQGGDRAIELYRVAQDPFEELNLAASEPGKTQELLALLDTFAGLETKGNDAETKGTAKGDQKTEKPEKALYESELIFPFDHLHNHGSSIVECADGSLLTCWYRGSGERRADDVLILGARRRKHEKEWSKPFLMADSPGFPDTNPCMFIDPRGRLWLIWQAIVANEWHTAITKYKIASDFTDDGPPRWDFADTLLLKPGPEFNDLVQKQTDIDETRVDRFPAEEQPKIRAYLAERRRRAADKYFSRMGWMTRVHPLVVEGKRLIVPLYSDGYDFSIMAISDDWGQNWTASAPLVSDGGVQPSLAQRRDGTIVAYMRDNGPPPKRVLSSESKDRGMTWSPVVDLELFNSGASVEVVSLRSGNWLLVNNDVEKGRHRLSVHLSDDEGRTWKWNRPLEFNEPGPDANHASYPSIIQGADGTIHATYTFTVNGKNEVVAPDGKRHREAIKHVRFNEAWAKEGGL